MTQPAIIMMTVAIITVWGGFVAAVIHLVKHPEDTDSWPAGSKT